MENKKVLLSVRDLYVNFKVRGRTLTAIRGIDLDLYEDESLAIVGESASGKSVFTKTFSGMLESNGYISEGSIIYNDEELSETNVTLTPVAKNMISTAISKLNSYAKLEHGAQTYRAMLELESEKKAKAYLTEEEENETTEKINDLTFKRTELYNKKLSVDPKKEKQLYKDLTAQIEGMDAEIKALNKQRDESIAARKKAAAADTAYLNEYAEKKAQLKTQYENEIKQEISEETKKRNEILAKEIYLSIGRYPLTTRIKFFNALLKEIYKAMQMGVDLSNDEIKSNIFDTVVFFVKYIDENETTIHGTCVLNLAKVKYGKDWTKIRGGKISTVFQDPMTSLNPIITIGKQITNVILKHQNCSELEARQRALELMKKVGIPKAEARLMTIPSSIPAV